MKILCKSIKALWLVWCSFWGILYFIVLCDKNNRRVFVKSFKHTYNKGKIWIEDHDNFDDFEPF